MSMWKDQLSSKKDVSVPGTDSLPPRDGTASPSFTQETVVPAAPNHIPSTSNSRLGANDIKESLIASDLTIEGKIEGSGHVRIAGKFKGDVNVQGDLTIEHGAKLTGGVKANKVIIAGELEGNIESAKQVDLLASGALTGDVKCGTMTIASGARMRGQADFGWDGTEKKKIKDKDSELA